MRFKKTYAALAALVVVAGLAVRLSAAPDDNNGNPTILEAVLAVQSTIDGAVPALTGLVSTVNGLVTTLNNFIAASAPGNTRTTPPVVAFAPDTIFCTATNVSAASKNIRVQVINANTAATLFDTGAAGSPVSPNLSTAGSAAGGAAGTRAICKFTVVNGTKDDIRAVLALFAASNASDKLLAPAD
jgi:hypothetical protein